MVWEHQTAKGKESSSNQTCWSKIKLATAAALVTLLWDGILFHPAKFLMLVEIKFPSFWLYK